MLILSLTIMKAIYLILTGKSSQRLHSNLKINMLIIENWKNIGKYREKPHKRRKKKLKNKNKTPILKDLYL